MQSLGDFLVSLLIYGGGPTVIAYVMFRFLGEKWIENKFAKQLEAERHQHAKELHELKKRLDSELSRIVKLQDREFSVLTEAWDLLQDALGEVSALLSMFRQYPDLSRLTDARLEEFLKNSRLSEVHRYEVKSAPDRNKHYQQLIFWYDLHDAKKAWLKYRQFINKNSIFLRAELNEPFQKVNGLMWDALVSREVGEEASDMKMWMEGSQKLRTESGPLVEELREKVRAILGTK